MSNYADSTAFLQQLATSAKLDAWNTTSKIWNLADGAQPDLSKPRFSHSVTKPTLGDPPRLTDLLDLNDTSDSALQKLNADADAWMTKYFPSIDTLNQLPEDWLAGVISGIKPFGLDQTVFELVWHRARDRAYRTMNTEQRQIEATFSARGFTIPPGAMVAASSEAADRASLAILEVNREQAVKDAEIKQALLQFALEQAMNYKRGILQALADFYRQWAALPDRDLERARLKAQAMSGLYSALSTYYNVQVSYEELALKAKQLATDTELANDRNMIAAHDASDASGKAAALGNAARAFADIASQAAQGAGTLSTEIAQL